MHACVYLCLLMNVCMRVHTHVHTRACMQCNLSRMCIHAVGDITTCAQYKLSFVPLLAPTSTDERIEKLAKTASSWIYAGAHPHSHSLSHAMSSIEPALTITRTPWLTPSHAPGQFRSRASQAHAPAWLETFPHFLRASASTRTCPWPLGSACRSVSTCWI